MPSRCCEFVDSRLRRSPPDRASAVPMDKPGKTQCVSPTLPTGRRLPHKLHSTPQQHGMILISAGSTPLAYSSPEAVQTTETVAAQGQGRPVVQRKADAESYRRRFTRLQVDRCGRATLAVLDGLGPDEVMLELKVRE